MFAKGTRVAWCDKGNAFIGEVLESAENTSVVLVTSTSKGRSWDGKKVAVFNKYLGDITDGRTVVIKQ